jgi:hypothetical protein
MYIYKQSEGEKFFPDGNRIDFFWDCDCEENYIHFKPDFKYCDKCDSVHHECSDSRRIEVLERYFNLVPFIERGERL